MSPQPDIREMARAARAAAGTIGPCPTDRKNAVLLRIAEKLQTQTARLQQANQQDLEEAKKSGLPDAMLDRLTLRETTLRSMVDGLREVVQLEDPIGTLERTRVRPNGLQVSQMRVPLGVIGIVYESRPNVTVDAAGLCLKAGNAVILRGGSEAFHSNQALADLIRQSLQATGLPEDVVQVLPVRDREAVRTLLQQEEFIDLIIPRGGEGLIRFVVENSKIPVLKHFKGVCHVFVDQGADLAMAEEICFNAKVQRPGVCNAMEALLVHEAVAREFLPPMVSRFQKAGVEIRGCPEARRLLPGITAAVEADWGTEFLDLILAVKAVPDIDQAMAHIARYGSSHTEAIVTRDYHHARRFLREVDASVVLVNASTRFNDGAQLGLGAEIGISTSKLHAFGPMGLNELTTRKFVVLGEGQVRK